MSARSPALALLGLLLLGACGLPPNTAMGDWSRSASIAADRPSLAAPPHAAAIRAMQEALGTYFYALGVLWDNADLTFREPLFAPLAAPAAAFDPVAGRAVQELAAQLRLASTDRPLQYLPRDNAGPRPLPEDWRLVNLIAASDVPVQTLLGALARAVTAEAPPPAPMAAAPAADPALRRLQLDRQGDAEAARAIRLAARQDYARLLPEIGAGHAALKARGRQITQREVERQVFLADDRLRRGIASLPREAPLPRPDALAAVLPP
ncbi:MAG: hypothetical protein K5Q68_02130 [Roseococcus sp.]|nr:hypothetical protein [Roseococcus sp.]